MPPKLIASAQSFLRAFDKSFVFIVHPGKRVEAVQDNIWVVPVTHLLG